MSKQQNSEGGSGKGGGGWISALISGITSIATTTTKEVTQTKIEEKN